MQEYPKIHWHLEFFPDSAIGFPVSCHWKHLQWYKKEKAANIHIVKIFKLWNTLLVLHWIENSNFEDLLIINHHFSYSIFKYSKAQTCWKRWCATCLCHKCQVFSTCVVRHNIVRYRIQFEDSALKNTIYSQGFQRTKVFEVCMFLGQNNICNQ